MSQTPDQFPRLIKEARAIDPAKREEWIAALTVAPDTKARLTRALRDDVTIASGIVVAGTSTRIAGSVSRGGAIKATPGDTQPGGGQHTARPAGHDSVAGTAGGSVNLQKPSGPAPDATIVTRGATLSDKAHAGTEAGVNTEIRRSGGVDPMIGRTFAGVVIERILGSGGMGRVYLGTDGPGGPAVALKVLLRTQRDDNVRLRFEREGRLLQELKHPCIANVLRTGVEEDGDIDVPYIVMEYVEGVLSITDYVFKHRLGTREGAQLFVQVCDAVGYAHAKGYMHRDLKPQNILVSRQGRVKVIDFGIARAVAVDSAAVTVRTETGQIVGTMQYMSPEQFKADPRLVDKRSDVYALAAVLYELVSGIQPHDLRGLPVHEAARIVCHADAPDVRECSPRIDAALATLLAEGLSRDASKRPDDALAFGRRLKGWLSTPQPTLVQTIHVDHPDKIFNRQTGRPETKSGHDTHARVPRPSGPRRGKKTSRAGWGVVTVVTGMLVVAVLVAFEIVPLRQVITQVRHWTGTRSAAAVDTLPAPPSGATIIEQVRVVTAPEGATIRVNGESRGVSPAVVLAELSRGGSVEIEASKDGWQTARARWAQNDGAPLVALNLAPAAEVDRLQRAFVFDVTGLPKGARLVLKEPMRQALDQDSQAVLVNFFRSEGKWQPVPLEVEALGADGQPLGLQVGARRGLGVVRYDLLPEDARSRLRVRVTEPHR